MTISRITAVGAFLAVTASLITSSVSAAPGGRVELTDLERTVETRDGLDPSKVTEQRLGSGILQVHTLRPEASGTATIHPCGETPPSSTTFRLDPETIVQYAKVVTAEVVCLTSTTPVHVIVDRTGAVSPTPTLDGDQYVALPEPLALQTRRYDADETVTIARPTELSASATAAVLAIEILQSDISLGFANVRGCAAEANFVADVFFERTRSANIAIVPLDATDNICVFSSAPATLRISLLGELNAEGPNPASLPPSWRYVPGEVPAPSLRSVNPTRVLDTRSGTGRSNPGKLLAGDVLEVDFGPLVGSLTTAVSMNVTAVRSDGTGFLTVWPCGADVPVASNLNFVADLAVPNLVVTKLSPTGTACISASSDVDVLADVNGTYEADGGLHAVPVEPERILDTRQRIGVADLGPVGAGQTLELQVTGALIPEDAGAATINFTAIGVGADGFATVYPCDADRPATSNLNFVADRAIPNLVTTALSDSGSVCVYVSADAHLIADLAAWYGLERPAGLIDLEPRRFLDTRDGTGVDASGPVTSTRVVELQVAGSGDVANDASAVLMNVTAARAEGAGFVTVWPCDQTQPTVSNLNYDSDRTIANLTTVKLSTTGTVCLTATAETDLIADVTGYLSEAPVDGVSLELG